MASLTTHEFEEQRFANARAIAQKYEARRRWFYGKVTRVGRYGFQIQSRPGEWLNICRYAKPAPTLPEIGKEYRIIVDGNERVHDVIPLDDSEGEDIPF